MSNNVIELKFRSPHVDHDGRDFLACKHCRNKTFLMILDRVDDFPVMQCAACGQHIGKMGWWHDVDEASL